MLYAAGEIKISVRFDALPNATAIRFAGASLLILTIHHERVMRHSTFNILAFGRGVVEPFLPKWRTSGQEISVPKPTTVGQYLLTFVIPNNVQVVSVLMRAGVERRTKSKITTFLQNSLLVRLWRTYKSVTAFRKDSQLFSWYFAV